MIGKDHHYSAALRWTGNRGTGTSGYRDYDRSYTLAANGKPELEGSSDPTFRGDAAKWNPEEMLLSALSSCHMLSYLHLCADAGITVLEYTDDISGTMELLPGGMGRFTGVTLRPRVMVSDSADLAAAEALHDTAHRACFIANSVNFPVRCEAVVLPVAHAAGGINAMANTAVLDQPVVESATQKTPAATPFVGTPRKATTHTSQNEGLIFEKSSPGKKAYRMDELDVPAVDAAALLGSSIRKDLGEMPEMSEIEIVRHFTRLSTWNYAIDLGMFPLGSCTMKYNGRVNEAVSRFEGIAEAHPYQPVSLSQGALGIMKQLQDCLLEITGMDAITLQPAAGAHGEFTGVLMIRAYHQSKGNPRKKVLVPDSAHGTNPATAAVVGYQVQNLKSNAEGAIDLEALRAAVDEDTAALMLTNPSTIGVFESQIHEIADILHAKGALLYMDGANMNALVGKTRPGDFGADVMHLNLHKTFSTPHGGGGPGSGPVACKAILEPFLPKPTVVQKTDGTLGFDYDRPLSVGRVRMFYGNFGMFVRALAYTLANGPDGLRQTTEDAVLNANYIRAKLDGYFDLPYKTASMHEVVFSDRLQAKNGVKTGDMGKRLIDYGFHAYTTSFPQIVSGAMMIEPTESESREELDLLIDALQQISREAAENPELVKTAPHSTRIRRLDETGAARKPILRWKAPIAKDSLEPDSALKEW